MQISRTFSLAAVAPAVARDTITEFAPLLPSDRLDDLRLIASELITNTVLHSGLREGDRVEMKIQLGERRVRIEVVDKGKGFPKRPAPMSFEHGWGLAIVGRIADRWGRESGPATRVWAELALA